MHLGDQIEHLLSDRRAAGLPAHFVLPHYRGYSIANLAPTVARLMGTTLGDDTQALDSHIWTDLSQGVNCVVLLILDAVGYYQLGNYVDRERSVFRHLARRGRLVPITSIFPSTTVSALTSIWTGRPPLGHGFLGTKLLLPRQGVLANMLKMKPAAYGASGSVESWGWDADAFIDAPRLAEQLVSAGVRTVAHTRATFIGSSLTRILLRGMEQVRGYVGLSDLWINLRRTLRERQATEKLFVDVYWSGVDNVGHVYGPEGDYLPSTLRHFARSFEEDFLAQLPRGEREGVLLIVTADHGQIATPPQRVTYLPDHPALQEALLLPPAGESRAAYLYARPGQKDAIEAYVLEHLSDRFVLLDMEQALEIGLFGPTSTITPDLRVRLGDLLLTARDDSRLSARERDGQARSKLRGHHGGLTREEMLVPLLMARLDRF